MREKVDKREKYDIDVIPGGALTKDVLPELLLFPPIFGELTNKMNISAGHFGVDIIAPKNEAVVAILKGTIVYQNWAPNDGHVVHIQHKNNLLSIDKKSIILIGSRYPLFLNKSYFDNSEGGIEGYEWNLKFEHVEDSNLKWQDGFKNSIKELSINKNISVILTYPIPEAGWHVPKKLLSSLPKKWYSVKDYLVPENYLTTSYEVFKNRTKSSFELLDSINGDNIYRVYPHKLFCDTNVKERCVTHDNKNIFYADDDHPSFKGAEMINSLIMKKIK